MDNPGKRPERVHRPGGPTPQRAGKIQRIMRAAEEMQRNGEDVQPIQKVMQQVGPLLQQGRQDEAEKLIRQALKVAGEDPDRANEDAPRDERKKPQ